MEPRELILNWVDAFNKQDTQTLSEFYADDAINHQVNTDPLKGKKAIKEMFDTEFAKANMVCIVENIFQENDWGILEWRDPLGLRGCGFFHIQNDKIIFQRGYWDKLSFLRIHRLPIPSH